MPMYNLIESSNNYSKAAGGLWQYYRDESALTNASAVAKFHAANNSASFKFKDKITGVTATGCTKDVEAMVQLKYVCDVWRTYEIPLINCEINIISTWSEKCVLSNDTKQ